MELRVQTAKGAMAAHPAAAIASSAGMDQALAPQVQAELGEADPAEVATAAAATRGRAAMTAVRASRSPSTLRGAATRKLSPMLQNFLSGPVGSPRPTT
jgi:hypothetical protein